ncbi:hypothetical protein RDI58_022159 [Solanum bulbocastanum]|uniref:Reverse transcriptase zinc-binding domain-containing protein n=1 Tax=Solanum bulbocastanum TaxID=147425 RepID=A0AAN8T1J0_SOLBU
MPQHLKVTWSKLVLVQCQIPWQQFILWLGLHRKLSTVDRVQKWGIVVSTDCLLCNDQVEETPEHLFFDCPYSAFIRSFLVKWLDHTRSIGDWNQEVQWLTQRISNSRPQAGMLGFCCAAAVYQL